jgi:hypothetical protein
MYVNGVLDSSDLSTPVLNLTTENPLWIGANHQDQNQQNYDGLMDDLRIYKRAISPGEVVTLYEGKLIVQQPQSQLGYWGKSVSFSVQIDNGAAAVTYVPPFTYQWLKDGVEISDATSGQLELLDLKIDDAGDYTVLIKDSANNTVASQAATLTVNPARASIATYAGITIEGVPGRTYGVQMSTDLGLNTWTNVANVTLTQPIQIWYDSQSTAQQPQGFYRVVVRPITVP